MSTHLRASPALQHYTIERLDAIDGHDDLDFAQMVVDGHLRQRAFESVMFTQRRVWGQQMTGGALGCLLSHAKAWERSVQMNASILVLEDDVELLSPAFDNLFPRAPQQLPANFGLLYLGDMAEDRVTIRATDYSSELKRISRPLWGTYAYIVSPLAAQRLLMHMFPADLQVDSYIRQVAELYAHDMPNFVVAQNIVYTDNSEARDTDAQVQGDASADPALAGRVGRTAATEEMRYHVLLPPSAAGGDVVSGDHREFLQCDSSYWATTVDKTSVPRVSYHSEAAATRHAIGLGLITNTNALRTNDNDASWRWLLCLAIAIHHGGGMCFAESYVMLRSIHHLLLDVQIGAFMASTSRCEEDAYDPTLAQVVYVSPTMTAAATLERLKRALRGIVSKANAPNTHTIRRKILKQRVIATMFPPHIFDPLLPLQRPCHCAVDQLIFAWGCKSRCDRMIAPAYAAGYPTARFDIHPRAVAKNQTPLQLHIALPNISKHTHASTGNLNTWNGLHKAPNWVIHVLHVFQEADPLDRPPHPGPSRRESATDLHSFCAGLTAVAEHGGAYVHVGLAPRQGLLDGVLSGWDGLLPPDAPKSNAHHGGIVTAQPAPVALWADAGPDPLRPANSNPGHSRSSTSRRSTKQLSWRFFAAPRPYHPVAVRMASACHRLIDMANRGVNKSFGPLDKSMLLQLQHVLADDASSVQFYAEQSVFDLQDERIEMHTEFMSLHTD